MIDDMSITQSLKFGVIVASPLEGKKSDNNDLLLKVVAYWAQTCFNRFLASEN